MLDDDKIEKNYMTFEKLCTKLGERTDAVRAMLDVIGVRLAVSPASSRAKYHSAFPGGLVDHSLRVLQNAKILNDNFKFGIPFESLIISCLFHDLGKAGDETSDMYLTQTSDWHREKLGEMYTINEEMQRMPNAERGLWLLQKFGAKLSLDEWIAIRCNDGQYVNENKPYAMVEPTLSMVVHMADRIACQQEKEIK